MIIRMFTGDLRGGRGVYLLVGLGYGFAVLRGFWGIVGRMGGWYYLFANTFRNIVKISSALILVSQQI